MKLTLNLPDDLYETYRSQAKNPNDSRSIEAAFVAQLTRFSSHGPLTRVLVIDNDTRAKMEDILPGNPGPSLASPEDLLHRISTLAAISIGDVRLDFTPKQLEYLKNVAERQGRTVKELVADTVRRMEEQFFDQVPML